MGGYIDDTFMIWQHTRGELDQFVSHLNSRHPTIRFTMEVSTSEIPFLDTLVKIKDQKLVTDLYSKPTDSHNYLLYESAHPQRCKDSIPYSQFLRIRRICSDILDFDRHMLTYVAFFP